MNLYDREKMYTHKGETNKNTHAYRAFTNIAYTTALHTATVSLIPPQPHTTIRSGAAAYIC